MIWGNEGRHTIFPQKQLQEFSKFRGLPTVKTMSQLKEGKKPILQFLVSMPAIRQSN